MRGSEVVADTVSLAKQIMEIVGYSCRLVSHYHPFVVNYFVVQYFFVVVSPVFFVCSPVAGGL